MVGLLKPSLLSSSILARAEKSVIVPDAIKRQIAAFRYTQARDALMTGPRATPPRWKKIRKVLASKVAVTEAMVARHAPLWQHHNALDNKPIFGRLI